MSEVLQEKETTLAGKLVHGPVGFRKLLERLGPTFIKLGQFLAMRPDVVPQRYCDELMSLLDRVPPFPWEQAKAILTEDLGADPSEIFELINPRPAATGSLAQVHRAYLHDGTEVAVKILRPGIREAVERDLKRSRLLARVLELSGATLILDPRETVAELSRWMLREIDLERELANLTRLYRLTAHSRIELIPRPYPDLCGPRVLTLEYLQGVSISDIITARRTDRRAELERIESLGIDRTRLAENLVTACLQQIFRYQFFHADLHPGNLMAMPGSAIGFVDFGLCDELDETIRDRQVRYLSAIYDGDPEQIYKATLEVLDADERSDLTKFRREVYDLTGDWMGERTKDRKINAGSRVTPAAAKTRSANDGARQWPPGWSA